MGDSERNFLNTYATDTQLGVRNRYDTVTRHRRLRFREMLIIGDEVPKTAKMGCDPTADSRLR